MSAYGRKLTLCSRQNNEQQSNPFGSVSNAFVFFGINLVHPKPSTAMCEKIIRLQRKFIILCWILTSLALVSYFHFSLKYVSDKNFGKLRLAKIIQVLNALLLWCVLYRSSENISSVIRDVAKLGRKFRVEAPSNFIRFYFVLIPLVHALLCFSVLYPYDEGKFAYILKQFSFELLAFEDRWQFYLLSFSVFVHDFLVNILPLSFVSLYTVLCRHLKEILSTYVQTLEHPSYPVVTTEYIREIFLRYNAVLSVLDRFENAMTFPTFLVSSTYFAGIFLGILALDKGYEASYMPVATIILISVFCSVAFVVTSLVAAGVNEVDKRARSLHQQLLAQMLPTANNLSLDMKISFLAVNSGPAFALTGWGFYQSTKGFILGAVGCLLTYTLLLTNL